MWVITLNVVSGIEKENNLELWMRVVSHEKTGTRKIK